MNRGLYIGASALIANQKRLDVLSNNLSNVNTSGYKKDIVLEESFPEVLLKKINDLPGNKIAGGNGVTVEKDGQVYTAHTDNGYFMVKTPMGTSYQKDIEYIVDGEGNLSTFYKNNKGEYKTDGENYIVGQGGNPTVYTPSPSVIGTMGAGAKFHKIITDFSQGDMVETGGNLDISLKGPGFFKVEGQNGEVFYTRDGSFSVNNQGELVTLEGHRVLGKNGGPITIGENSDIKVTKGGQVISGGEALGTLDIVDLDNEEYLRKIGNNLYKMIDGVGGEEIPFNGQVLQGYLESSNIDSIKELVEMITLMRNFESCQKVIRVQDEMLEKSANEIGRV